MPKKKGCIMTKNVPAFIARTQFGQILDRASKNKERFLVTKKGEAKAIILIEKEIDAVRRIKTKTKYDAYGSL